ncbi:hypothetical protein BX666DRAFT_1940819 [Dichotomocladium elegans]|nr:hypothetical protein BX666DRAFT_1940819 [Dichotomocladium elegans]
MISTDGAGVTVFQNLRVPPMSTVILLKANKELIPYITSLSRAGHVEISGRCVVVDLMCCVHEESTSIAPRQSRHTQS